MRTKFIRSLLFVALSTTAISSVQASWYNQDDRRQSSGSTRQAPKRTFDDIYQTPPSNGSGLFSTLCSMTYSGLSSVGSFLSSSLFGSASQEDTRDTVPTRMPLHAQALQADVQSHLGHAQHSRKIVTPRRHIMDPLPHAPEYHGDVLQQHSYTPIRPISSFHSLEQPVGWGQPSHHFQRPEAPNILDRPFLDSSYHTPPRSHPQVVTFSLHTPTPVPTESIYQSMAGVRHSSHSTIRQPIQIDSDDNDQTAYGKREKTRSERPKKKQRKGGLIDLTAPFSEANEEVVFVFPEGTHTGSLHQATPQPIQIDDDFPEIMVEEKKQPPHQESHPVVDLEDSESIQRDLRTYSIERRYNQMEPIYMEWYKELSVESGLKRAYADKKISDEWGDGDPEKLRQIERQINVARAKLIELAKRHPIARILKSRGFSDKEIRYARDQRFLNFYEN